MKSGGGTGPEKPGNHSCLIQTGTGAKSCKILCILKNKRVREYFCVYPCLSVREAFFDSQEISTRNPEGRSVEHQKMNLSNEHFNSFKSS